MQKQIESANPAHLNLGRTRRNSISYYGAYSWRKIDQMLLSHYGTFELLHGHDDAIFGMLAPQMHLALIWYVPDDEPFAVTRLQSLPNLNLSSETINLIALISLIE